jgi:hypothetical protein
MKCVKCKGEHKRVSQLTYLFHLINTYSPHHSLLVLLVKIALCMGCKLNTRLGQILVQDACTFTLNLFDEYMFT